MVILEYLSLFSSLQATTSEGFLVSQNLECFECLLTFIQQVYHMAEDELFFAAVSSSRSWLGLLPISPSRGHREDSPTASALRSPGLALNRSHQGSQQSWWILRWHEQPVSSASCCGSATSREGPWIHPSSQSHWGADVKALPELEASLCLSPAVLCVSWFWMGAFI